MVLILARRLAGSGTALLTLAIWLTQAGQWRWRSSYLSETTTTVLWLAGWWFLLRWREDRKPGWMLGIAIAAALGAITRPVTMLAWTVPVAIVIIRDTFRSGRWMPLFWGLGAAIPILLLVPIQNHATLGDWHRSPLALYTSQYMPLDRIGFGLDSTPPILGLPLDLQPAMAGFVERHREHTVKALPRIVATRLAVLGRQVAGQWRVLWLPALLLGLILLGRPGWFALGTGIALYAGYLLYAHEPHWTAYYTEMTPTIAFPVAIGLGWALTKLIRAPGVPLGLAALVGLLILGLGAQDIAFARAARAAERAPLHDFERLLRAKHTGTALVFIRPDMKANPHLSFIRNVPDPETAVILTARDMGDAGNRTVAAAYPGRTPFLWDQQAGRLTAMRFEAGTP
ncbi:MAG: hypothetical protein ACT4PM_14380 [Gemmatimonadales bacterium]